MVAYLIKSVLCLGILWAVYHFWLSKEQLFKFNRFYLLASILFSLIAPSIVFETVTYIDLKIPDWSRLEIAENLSQPAVVAHPFNWELLGHFLYWPIALLLAIRFSFGVFTLLSSVRKNPAKKWNNASLILLLKPLVPHTFLNYIFINKTDYEQDKIKEELLLHEYEHVKQKHSYDILFVEFLQLFFWFNPFLYLIKKSIKLNHEFLADNAVLKTDIEIHKYQELLLKTVGLAHPTFLSSSINYSITKKRLKMMTKSNHKVKRWGFTFLLLPLFAVLLFSFSMHDEVIKERTNNIKKNTELKIENSVTKWLRIRINGKKIVINGKASTLEKFTMSIDKLTSNWTQDEMQNYKADVQIQNVPDDFLKKLNEEYKKTKLFKANPTDHGLIPPPPPPPSRVGEVIEVPMPSSDKEIIYIYEDSEVSPSEIEEYNSIVKRLNAVSDNQKIIKIKELKKIKTIHGKMSDTQRKEALPFPNIPPPPPPAIDTIYTYKRLAKRIQNVPKNRKANIIYLKKLYEDMSASQQKSVKSPEQVFKSITDVEVIEVVEEPEVIVEEITETPSPPKDPLDHIIHMAKKGAVFYIEGKKVSSDKAIKYAKENKSFKLETKRNNSKTPSVYISKSKKKTEVIEESGNRGPSVGEINTKHIKQRAQSSITKLAQAENKRTAYYKNAKNYGKHYYQVSLFSKQKWERYVKDGKLRALSSSAVIMIKLNNKIMVKGT